MRSLPDAHFLACRLCSAKSNQRRDIQALEHEHGLIVLVEPHHCSPSGVLRIEGLLPNRHYLLRGAAHRFCRADAAGAALVELAVYGPTLLVIAPVI